MTEMAINIMTKLFSVVALAIKQISQGQFSTSIVAYHRPWLTRDKELGHMATMNIDKVGYRTMYCCMCAREAAVSRVSTKREW